MPVFHARLAEEAEPFLIVRPVRAPAIALMAAMPGAPGTSRALETPGAPEIMAGRSGDRHEEHLGYVLLLTRPHAGHQHVTVIELYLKPEYHESYEDVLDLLREQARPTAYLVRTDECTLDAALLARGLQVEPTALVMTLGMAAALPRPADAVGSPLELEVFLPDHIPALRQLLTQHDAPTVTPQTHDGHTHGARENASKGQSPSGRTPAEERLAELEVLAGERRHWVGLEHGSPVAVIARADGGDGEHELIDFALAHAGESALAEAVLSACDKVRSAGREPAAVIDATETARRGIFRRAGFHTEVAYMIFYDAEAGRPSVATVSLAELTQMIDRGEKFRLVDVLGEDHWKRGHIHGSEWIDFRGLAREAKRRFAVEEPIVVYCDGFT